MLNVRHASRERTDRGAVSETTPGGDKSDDDYAATDLEPSIMDIAVRHPITGKVQRNTKESGSYARAHSSPHCRPGRSMKGRDHQASS